MIKLERLRKIGFSQLTSLEDALTNLFPLINLNSIETIQTAEAFNRVLAEDIFSEFDIPPFNRSAMDGYAIKAEDTFGASLKNPKKVKKIGTIEIGETSELILKKGEAIRISTGAVIPDGADAVIKIEDTEIEKEVVNLYTSLVPGKNVSKKGEDIPKNTQILSKGLEIKAEHIALLSSLGINKINVRQKPKISVFATGNELIEVGMPLEKNKIYNSNTPMISNLINLYGGMVIKKSTLKDDIKSIKNVLHEALNDSQIIVLTGGTSVGTKDLLPEIIYEIGTVLTHGIAIRPGAPILIGKVNNTLVFCLPGTPVAAFICFLVIVGPTIRKMLGCPKLDPRIIVSATINKDVPVGSMGYVHYLRVKIEESNRNLIAIPVKLKGSGVISSLTKSDGIVDIPPFQEGLKKGDNILVKLHPK